MAEQLDLLTKRARQAPAPLEFLIHITVAEILDRWVTPGWQWTHIASGEFRTKATAGRLKRMGVKPGWPDFLLISPKGFAHCLELKRERDARMSEAQKAFRDWAFGAGVPHVVAKTPNEALDALKFWGAVRTGVHVQ